MLNMIGGVGAGSVTAGLLSQAPETWNPALYQLAVNVHDVAVKPLTSVVFTVVLYVRFIELYALTAFQSLPFAFLVHEDTKPIGVGFFKSHARTSANAVCLPFALWGWWRPKGLKPELTFQRCLTHNLHPSWREHHGIGISPVTVLTQMITNHGDEPVRNEHTAYAGTRLGIGDSHVTTICSPSIDGMPDTQRSRLKIDIPNLQSAQSPASQTRCSVCHLR